MIRKLEKGEQLKVGDVIELVNGGIGTVSKLGTGAIWVHWNGRTVASEEGYSLYDPIVQGSIATAVITREEPEGKWTPDWDSLVAPDGRTVSIGEACTILDDQAATIERLKKVMLDCAERVDALGLANLTATLRQEAEKQ